MKPHHQLFLAIGLVGACAAAFAVWYHTRYPANPLEWTFGGVVSVEERMEPPPPIETHSDSTRALAGFFLEPGAERSLDIVLPPDAALDLTLWAPPGAAGRFELRAEREEDEAALVRSRDLAELAGWLRDRARLGAYPGPVRLTFRLTGTPGGAEVFLGDPRLCVPESRLRRRVLILSCDDFDPQSNGFADLTEEGFLYEAVWPAASDPVASWATILTGLHSVQHRAGFERGARLPEAFLTLPELLVEKGWASTCFVSGLDETPAASLFQGFGEVAVHSTAAEATADTIDWLDHFGDSPSLVAVFLKRSPADPEPWRSGLALLERVLAGELEQTLVLVMGARGEGGDSGGEAPVMPPLWIAGASLPGGGSTSQPAHQVGVFLTICHALKIDPPRDLEGETLLAPIGGYEVEPMRLLYEAEDGRCWTPEGWASADATEASESVRWIHAQQKRFGPLFDGD